MSLQVEIGNRVFPEGNVAVDKRVGARIRALRRQRGLSQAALGNPELSNSYVSLIESGRRAPTPAVLDLLAAKLGCSRSYLLNGVTPEQITQIEEDLRRARRDLEAARWRRLVTATPCCWLMMYWIACRGYARRLTWGGRPCFGPAVR
ncbi:helix-turn-helix domain-containing protein [Streptosporangium lutulentum]